MKHHRHENVSATPILFSTLWPLIASTVSPPSHEMHSRRPTVPVGPSDFDVKLCDSPGHALEMAHQQMLLAGLDPLVYLSLPLTKPSELEDTRANL